MVEVGLMKNRTQYIEKVIHSIDWRKIKSYYRKLGIQWEYQEDKEMIKRTPSVADLKDDFRSILSHMLDQDINYISYGSWIIFWDREENDLGDIRVIFRLADFIFEEDKKSAAGLEEKLKQAVEREDYEYAAIIRDEIKNNISIS
jgi:excinuclease UvrABC helicase subunit UvrB